MRINRWVWNSKVLRRAFSIATLLALVLALLPPWSVFAIPQLGHYFYGDVTMGGVQAPAGTTLTAKIKGTTLEFSTVVDSNGHFGYSPNFSVPGDDPDTPEREGAQAGDLIEFYIAGQLARVKKIGGTDPLPSGVWRYDYPWYSGQTTVLQVDLELPTIGLSVEKVVTEPASGPATVGETVAFQVTVANTGGADLASVQISDAFPACLSFQSATQDGQPVSGVGPGSPLEWDLGPLAAGEQTVVVLTFEAAEASEACVNSVSVTGVDAWQREASASDEASVAIEETLPPPSEFLVTLGPGWNLFSTPVQLDTASSTLISIVTPETVGNVQLVLGWDPVNERWIPLYGDYQLQPLYAIYVKVKEGATAQARLVPSQQVTFPPSRQLVAGMNLIGPAPAYNSTLRNFPAMPLDQALISIAQAPGGLPGYTMVISPGLNQPGWAYALGGTIRDLLPYKGYWVVMENPDTLYGFSTTPIGQ